MDFFLEHPLLWLQSFYDLCTSVDEPGQLRLTVGWANIAICIAYYWIPLTMIDVYRKHRSDIPYPILWILFTAFIASCGTTHLVHGLHSMGSVRAAYSWAEAIVLIFTAAISLFTAAVFTKKLPEINSFVSPSATRKKLELEISMATADLREALAKEKLLLREVHHRVKNNLQVVSSLVNMQVRRTTDAGDKATLADLAQRITAMSQIHNQLQAAETSHFDLRSFITSLCTQFDVVYDKTDSILWSVDAEDYFVPYDKATPIALILNEIISNAFKHAFPSPRKGNIWVTLKNKGRGVYELRIRDNGVGKDTNAAKSKGIGLNLIDALILQLDATLVWDQPAEGGTECILTINP